MHTIRTPRSQHRDIFLEISTGLYGGLVGFLDIAIGLVKRSLRVVVGLQGALIFIEGAIALARNIENPAQAS